MFLNQTPAGKDLAASPQESGQLTDSQVAPSATVPPPSGMLSSRDQTAETERRIDSPSSGGAGVAASDMVSLQADRPEAPPRTPEAGERQNEAAGLGQLAGADSVAQPGGRGIGFRDSAAREDPATRREADARPLVETQVLPAPGAAAKAAETGFASANRARPRAGPPAQLRTRDEVSRRSQAAEYMRAPAVFQPVTMEEAVRQLSGAIRLIDGFTPEEFEVAAFDSTQPLVRVIYRVGSGEKRLVLEQQRATDDDPDQELAEAEVVADRDGDANWLKWNDLHGFILTLLGPFSQDSLQQFKARVK